ncbi:MAG: DNA-directed DNA polymerase II small subunit [Euryarchaeota archaeon]|nr:DNA-directed DNA polymerase II small subunit [Euryarchaeota archaeon]
MHDAEILNRFLDAELNVHPDTLTALMAQEDPLEIGVIASARTLQDCPPVITPEFLDSIQPASPPEVAPAEKPVEVKRPSRKTPAAEYDENLKIRTDRDITRRSYSVGDIEGFFRYFNDRYQRLARVLRERDQMRDVMDIESVKGRAQEEVTVIGMVQDVRPTRKGHVLISLEDPTGTVPALILNSDRTLMRLSPEVVKDEVIGVVGKMSRKGDLLIINDLLFPDLPVARKQKRSPDPVALALISDVHAGSTMFMEEAFEKFIRWMEGRLGSPRQQELAGKVKYLVIGGDLVDGVGIYPEQENELVIKDIFQQYEKIAEYISRIPEHVEVIIMPGNHDATRQAEPQPAILEEFAPAFYDDPRIHMVGNPCFATIHGVDLISYHGRSLDDIISTIPDQSYSDPEKAMLFALKKRHLAPIYGGKVPMSPEERDYLLIDQPPDILHFGHVHTVGVASYRGTTVVNSGTFQKQTSYQRKNNVKPDPARIPIIDLHEHKTTLMRFL